MFVSFFYAIIIIEVIVVIPKNTKVICTIGPKIANEESIKALINAGMNVVRFNMAHADYNYCTKTIKMIRKVAKDSGLYIGILIDTPGPKIRIGKLEGDYAKLIKGEKLTIVKEDIIGTKEKLSISYKELNDDVFVGSTIMLNDGIVSLTVKEVIGEDIVCEVENDGEIYTRRGVNVPGLIISKPFLGAKDISNIKYADEIDADFIALSFVSNKDDVLDVNDILIELNNDHIAIISKIENLAALENIEDILNTSDGIMVARGDLGVETPIEKLPIIQKDLVKRANDKDIISIVATQLLASMETCPTPTRAEITDVANAILDGADAIMLSGESAIGKYPIEATRTMSKIANSVEQDMDFSNFVNRYDRSSETDVTKLIAHNVVDVANRIEAKLIISSTNSGYTARNVSKFRPCCPIIASTPNKKTVRSLSLNWGVYPKLVDKVKNSNDIIDMAIKTSKEYCDLQEGDKIIITGGSPNENVKTTNFMKIEEF